MIKYVNSRKWGNGWEMGILIPGVSRSLTKWLASSSTAPVPFDWLQRVKRA